MGNDKTYIYGSDNGAEYEEEIRFESQDGKTGSNTTRKRTHWDPRIEVLPYVDHGQVQIGIIPPTPFKDRLPDAGEVPSGTPVNDVADDGVYEWFSDNGQFMHLDRSGLNRLIEALQEAGSVTFGRDRW